MRIGGRPWRFCGQAGQAAHGVIALLKSWPLCTVILLVGASTVRVLAGDQPDEIFADAFGVESRGERVFNLIDRPPPEGLSYATDVPSGYVLKNWIVVDVEPETERRAFWVIPRRTDGWVDDHAEQAGRSRDSIAYAGVPVPTETAHYVVEFLQQANDNDYIGFIVGAPEPVLNHGGFEFGYERQLPGKDWTVPDIYYRAPWGEGRIPNQAKLHRWVRHRIEVKEGHLQWSQDGEVLLAGTVEGLRSGGWFGIRHKYERGTRYRDFRIHRPNNAALPVAHASEAMARGRLDVETMGGEALEGRWKAFLARARGEVGGAPVEFAKDERDWSRRSLAVTAEAGLAYWYSGDRSCGERARTEAFSLIRRPTWRGMELSSPGTDKNLAEATLACALALAWCGDTFSAEQKAFVEWKLVELGVRPYLGRVASGDEGRRLRAGEDLVIDHGSAGFAAWLLQDRFPEARRAFDHVRQQLPEVFGARDDKAFDAGTVADHWLRLTLERDGGRTLPLGLTPDWIAWRNRSEGIKP